MPPHHRLAVFAFLFALASNTIAQDLSGIVPADSQLEEIAAGFGFTEGPALGPQGDLFFTDLRAGKIHTLSADGDLADFRTSTTDLANGLAFDAQGRLHACEGGSGRLTRTEADGTTTVLAQEFAGTRFNAPNDLALASDGSVYFTDPFFANANAQPQPVTGVYRIAADGAVTLVAADHDRPNGIVLSPDQNTLYVTNDSPEGDGQIWAYDRQADGSLANRRLFATAANVMDGMSIDAAGNVYATSFPFAGGDRGVWVYDPAGTFLGLIETPRNPTNCTLAGDILYITAGTAVYSIRLNTQGVDRTAVEAIGWGRLKAGWGMKP